jgi:hypothetical protein
VWIGLNWLRIGPIGDLFEHGGELTSFVVAVAWSWKVLYHGVSYKYKDTALFWHLKVTDEM